jgi:hypothetical protein
MPPIVIAGAIAAAGAVGGAAISSSAAGKAASTQAGAAKSAAQLQYEAAQNALGFQQQQWGAQQQQMQPYLQAGYGGLANLQNLLGIAPQGNYPTGPFNAGTSMPGVTGTPGAAGPMAGLTGTGTIPSSAVRMGPDMWRPAVPGGVANSQAVSAERAAAPGIGGQAPVSNLVNPQLGAFGSLAQGWNEPFVAPTAATEQNDPGYQFRLQQGVNALQNSAAARGNLLTGATAAGINAYGQDYASNEYSNVYGRALGQYQQAYNIFQQNQANQYNRLANLSGLGQVATQQLGAGGQAAAGNVGNILLGSAANIGRDVQAGAYQTASGYAGQANAWGGALSNLSQLAQLYALSKNPGQSNFLSSDQGGWGNVGSSTG